MDNDHIIELATAFAEVLRREMSAEDWAEMLRLNDLLPAGSPVCHSHDFRDSNMDMAEAFEAVTGREVDVGDEADAALWSRAWRVAFQAFLTISPNRSTT